MSQLKKGTILSYIKIVLANIIGLVLTPFIIEKLGDAEYGLYMLIGAFVGYISILDFGLNNTIVRFVAKYRAEKDKKSEENFLSISMGIYSVISLIIVIIGVILFFNLNSLFSNSLTLEELGKAKIMFGILIFNLAITLPGGAFTAICSGYEHFVFPRIVVIIRYVTRSFMVVGLLLMKGDAISLVILDTIFNLLVIGFNVWYVFSELKVTFKFHEFKLPLVKEIFSYSIWVFIYAVVHQFQWNAGQLVVGINTDTITVAIFAVGIMLGGYYAAFGGVINSVLIPKANQMIVSKSDGNTLTDKMVGYGRLNAFVLFLVLCGFILFGRDFIFLWLGNLYHSSWLIALIIMIAFTLPLIQGFGNSILEAKMKNRFKSLLSLITVSMSIIIGYYLTKKYGPLGVIVPLGIAILVNSIIMNIYFKRIFDFKPLYFFKRCFFKLSMVYLVVTLMCYYLKSFYIINTWGLLIIEILIFIIVYVVVTYIFLLNSYERNLLKRKLK